MRVRVSICGELRNRLTVTMAFQAYICRNRVWCLIVSRIIVTIFTGKSGLYMVGFHEMCIFLEIGTKSREIRQTEKKHGDTSGDIETIQDR